MIQIVKVDKDHEYCLRCGKKLKNIEYRKRGYGKSCFEKMQVNNRKSLFQK